MGKLDGKVAAVTGGGRASAAGWLARSPLRARPVVVQTISA